jgi:hypothetical protein
MTIGIWDSGTWDEVLWGSSGLVVVTAGAIELELATQAATFPTFVALDAIELELETTSVNVAQARDFSVAAIELELSMAAQVEVDPPGRSFTVPTYDVPILPWRLGEWGISFPRGRIVIIDTDDNVTLFPGAAALEDPRGSFAIAKDGNGENGKAVFKNGVRYRQLSQENYDLLIAAGYGDFVDPPA